MTTTTSGVGSTATGPANVTRSCPATKMPSATMPSVGMTAHSKARSQRPR